MDDYGCHLIQGEAATQVHDKLDDVINYEFKAALQPNIEQRHKYSADITAEEYINYCAYHFIIFICDDGENREQDYNDMRSALIDMCYNRHSDQYGISVYYFDREYYDSIIVTDPSTYKYNIKKRYYNYHGSGCIDSASKGTSSEFKWLGE